VLVFWELPGIIIVLELQPISAITILLQNGVCGSIERKYFLKYSIKVLKNGMKNIFYRIIIGCGILISSSISINAQTLSYGVPQQSWAASFGNHRAVLNVSKPSGVVRLKIIWRLHDLHPDKKRFLIINAASGDTIKNVYKIAVNEEECDIAFGPVIKAGKYYFYYLPYKPDPDAGYYQYGYLSPKTPDAQWVNNSNLSDKSSIETLPKATCNILQSRTVFDSFYPMEITSTTSEKNSFLSKYTDDYLLFPEDRKYPIKMQDDIPLKWIKAGIQKEFKGIAERNEYYTFQIGLYAAQSDIRDVTVHFSNLKNQHGNSIQAKSLTCFNTGGINSYGKLFTKKLDVVKGKVQALWMGVDIPANAATGTYEGLVTINAKGEKTKNIRVSIKINNQYLADRGDNESWRYSRLRWLNSTAGLSDKPTGPFTKINIGGNNNYSLYGKQIGMASDQMPASVKVFGTDVLNGPIRYVAEGEKFSSSKFQVQESNNGSVSGSWNSSSKNFELHGERSIGFDGYLHYTIHLKALKNADMKDFRLEIPFRKEVAQYIMGMGLPGSIIPDSLDAKWKGPHNSFWIGNTYGGIYCQLLGASYSGPLLNLYKPAPPSSWYNENKGGFSVSNNGGTTLATVYSGSRSFKKDEEISFEFDLIITPVKKPDTKAQFTERYYHNGSNAWPDSSAVAAGIKVINIHQGTITNPYINYPFVAKNEIKYFSDYWHRQGIKVKIYYTVRELTNHTSEIWALRSLGNEVFSKGEGGGFPWLQEHLINNYTPAWYTPIGNDMGKIDAAIETAPGDSRWYNFYIKGLAWLIKNEDIDGLYLDDVAFDRHIIKRMREAMDSVKTGCLIDLHSNTGFSIGPATQYTSFFPYINKLWFGESFEYNKMQPANWLVESSGIPFGLMGEMLNKGGNPWRGIIYGMTSRLGWETEGVICDPRPIWKVFDAFGIADAKMIGYWDKHAVVSTSNTKVLATAYVKNGKALVAIASWDDKPTAVTLNIDWKAMGLSPGKIKLYAPAIKNFQQEKVFSINEPITVPPAKGWILIIE